ncbi:putative Cys-tRNA(Pro)/Cys-tRNA(Cys) deacylase YjdI [Sporosarcina sp. NCCP-2716]|uniref:Cys-tRNA(Pro) deacylase n=1 Tax=Sporosarcina sp. NCCP-2716 TaxID=2943679 RepID=UPI002041F1B0|nr:Cys-tRNA(Pro) deacylase [Sporosarcina sp. NCCP-2716]GKV69080.1 putative Cys-tRNA(Pro)/Cys-tRNA(Cys) deacylase YjdI [Sporosarcina sp. NCCP-2716]
MAKKNKHIKTNAIRILESLGIPHELLERDLSEDANAAADGGNEADVYKTLVATAGPERYYVFVIPVVRELDLKKAARAAGEKKIEMLPLKQLTAVTGYVRGGCSAIGMKKQLPVFIDESAAAKPSLYASAGKPGFQMKLKPDDYAEATGGTFVDLCK